MNEEDEYGFPYDLNIEKKCCDKNDSSAYGYIPEIPRLYYKSHIFGGSHIRDNRSLFVLNQESMKFVHKTITTPPLQEKVYLEILSNVLDNAFKSQRMGVNFPKVIITMDKDTISICNGGVPIPVDIHEYFYGDKNNPKFGTVAELIFSVIGAGSNTNEGISKQGGGQNGYGAKLTNVFSRKFEVEIGDNIRGFQQRIGWKKNMMEKEYDYISPEYATTTQCDQNGLFHIVPNGQPYTGENYVKVTWKQDFRKFDINYFTQDDLQLYMKYAAEASFAGKFVVEFNGKTIDARSAVSYINMYPKEISKNSIVHYEFPDGQKKMGKALETSIANQEIIPTLELMIIDTPHEGKHISYCNGVYNTEGGVHTDASYREVLKAIKDVIKSNKSFDKGIDLGKVNIGDLKKHATIVINYKCKDPVFKGQDKEKLMKPTPKINISPDEMGKIKKWGMVNEIYTTITGKHLKELKDKKGGGKGRIKDNFQFFDANWFGTKRQNETVLILCEGKSASSYVLKWILATPERKDKYATFLMRGKFKNVTDLGIMELLENKEIRELIEYMGFEVGADYTDPKIAKTLRYAYIYIMVDADPDGNHIQSLVFNFLYRLFPSFIAAGRLFYVPTPVIRVLNSERGGTKHIFYNMFDYKKYVESIGGAKHHAKYFKGLASGKDTYAAEDSKHGPLVYANFDQLVAQSLDIAFKKGLTTERKKWIELWRDKIDTEILHQMDNQNPRLKYANISDYINTKLVEYSIYSFSRALPSYKDGLKKSQRQLLWTLLHEWNFGKSNKKSMNLQAIALNAKVKTGYCHGDLTDTLARLGSVYPGPGNITLLEQEGQFGTREHLGSDVGAARYVETKPASIFKHIFDKELLDLVDSVIVQGEKAENIWVPIKIPLHVAIGVAGIASAYSLKIPGYHIIDLIDFSKRYITGNLCFPLMPWYRGFNGDIELEIFKNKYSRDKELIDENGEDNEYYEGLTLATKGCFEVIKEYEKEYSEEVNGKKQKVRHKVADVRITEIPIGVATAKYRNLMEKKCDWVEDKSVSADTPDLILHGWKDKCTHKDLKLIDRMGMCNITLIDDDSFPYQYRNVYEVIKLYCDNMIELYIKLKEVRLKKLEDEIILVEKKIKLIDLLINEVVIAKHKDEAMLEKELLEYGIEFEIYDKLERRAETKQGYKKYTDKLEKLKNDHNRIKERHHLSDWCEDLDNLRNIFSKDKDYVKQQKHCYPIIETPIEDLISGKVKSPFQIKEEKIPESI